MPVIPVTANARKEQIEIALAAGMVSYREISIDNRESCSNVADLTRGQDDVVPKPFRVSERLRKIKVLKQPG